jgi:hypothetical protein
MKNTLLIAAAALAAGVISSQAGVYSQNIVGYVNVTAPAGFVSINTPLANPGANNATNIFDTTSGNNDGSTLLLWTGTKYQTYVFASSSPTGFKNAAGNANVASPDLSPGQGYFFNNQNDPVIAGGVISNLTYVGQVEVDLPGSSTNVVGISTNFITGAGNLVYIASKFPIGGGVSTVLGLTNDAAGDMDGSYILVPNIVSGAIRGYVVSVYASTTSPGGSSTGFKNAAGTANVPEPVISVGEGFLISNQSGNDYVWYQSL